MVNRDYIYVQNSKGDLHFTAYWEDGTSSRCSIPKFSLDVEADKGRDPVVIRRKLEVALRVFGGKGKDNVPNATLVTAEDYIKQLEAQNV